MEKTCQRVLQKTFDERLCSVGFFKDFEDAREAIVYDCSIKFYSKMSLQYKEILLYSGDEKRNENGGSQEEKNERYLDLVCEHLYSVIVQMADLYQSNENHFYDLD